MNSCIQYIANDAGKIIGLLSRTSKYLAPTAMLYLPRARLETKYSIATISRLEVLVLIDLKIVYAALGMLNYFPPCNLFSLRRKVANHYLSYRYSYDMCSDELHSLVSPALTFSAGTLHATSTRVNDPHFLLIPRSKKYVPLAQHLNKNCFVEQTSGRMLSQ